MESMQALDDATDGLEWLGLSFPRLQLISPSCGGEGAKGQRVPVPGAPMSVAGPGVWQGLGAFWGGHPGGMAGPGRDAAPTLASGRHSHMQQEPCPHRSAGKTD